MPSLVTLGDVRSRSRGNGCRSGELCSVCDVSVDVSQGEARGRLNFCKRRLRKCPWVIDISPVQDVDGDYLCSIKCSLCEIRHFIKYLRSKLPPLSFLDASVTGKCLEVTQTLDIPVTDRESDVSVFRRPPRVNLVGSGERERLAVLTVRARANPCPTEITHRGDDSQAQIKRRARCEVRR